MLFLDDAERYLSDGTWVRSFGEPLLAFVQSTAVGGFKEQRVLFHDGLEVDFSILPVAAAEAIPPDAQAVLGRGFSIVYDEIELALERTTVASTPPPPTQAGLEPRRAAGPVESAACSTSALGGA